MTLSPHTAFPKNIKDLQAGLLNGEYSCLELINAFIEKIEQNNEDFNAIVVPLFEKARAKAATIDWKIENSAPLGDLFGVPVTIKECLDVEDTPSTWGLPSKKNDRAEENDPIIDRLFEADAVILGKTNVQQLLLGSECHNPVYGRTFNPHHPDRTPGGSSGGEGAALAAGFSLVGIGTDVGGSVRIPAHFSGVHGLKPTSATLPMRPGRDIFIVKPEVARLFAQPGIMASTIPDLKKTFLTVAKPAQPSSTQDLKELKVGYFKQDGIVEPSFAIQRLVDEAVHHLQDHGFQVQALQLPNLHQMCRSYLQLMLFDARDGYEKTIGNNRTIPKIQGVLKLLSIPSPIRSVLATIILPLSKQKLTADLIFKAINSTNLDQLLEQQKRHKEEILDYLKDHSIDLIICPPYPTPALKHDTDLSVEGAYAQVFNYLGFPAGVVSLSHVQQGDIHLRKETGDRVIQVLNETDLESIGLPIGLQVAAPPHQETRILDLMAFFEETFSEDN